MADLRFTIDRVSPTVYLDNKSNAVNGYLIEVTLLDYNEGHVLRVASLDEKIVNKAVNDLLKQRDALAKFSPPA